MVINYSLYIICVWVAIVSFPVVTKMIVQIIVVVIISVGKFLHIVIFGLLSRTIGCLEFTGCCIVPCSKSCLCVVVCLTHLLGIILSCSLITVSRVAVYKLTEEPTRRIAVGCLNQVCLTCSADK